MSTAASRSTRCARARSTPTRCGCCSTSSSSARLLPRLLEAIGEVAEVPEADVLEVTVVTARDAQAAETALLEAGEQTTASRSNRGGRESVAGARSSGSRSRPTRQSPISTPSCSRDGWGARSTGRARRRRLPGARRAPCEGIDARTRRRAAVRRARHRGDGVSPRPGRREVLARRPLAPLPLDRAAIPRPGRGHARPRRRRRRDRDRPPRRDPRSNSPTRSAKRCAPASSRSCTRTFELPLVPVLARMEDAGVRIDVAFLNELGKELGDQCRQARGRDPRAGGRAVQRQLDAAAAPDPLREAGPHAGQAHQDRPVDRRGLAAEDGGGRTRSSRRCCGTAKSRSCAARTPTRCRRWCVKTVASTRPFNQLATTTGRISSESPNLQNIPVRTSGGRELRQRVHRRRRLRAAHRRLLADRAARARAPVPTIPA